MAREKKHNKPAPEAQTRAEAVTPGDTPSAEAPKGKTVMVALNRASGIIFNLPGGRTVRIAGNAADLKGKEKGVLPVGAYGLTQVDADDWAYIEKTYGPYMQIFKSGLIFSTARKADALDMAEERAELRHGLEPVAETGPGGANVKPFDGVGE